MTDLANAADLSALYDPYADTDSDCDGDFAALASGWACYVAPGDLPPDSNPLVAACQMAERTNQTNKPLSLAGGDGSEANTLRLELGCTMPFLLRRSPTGALEKVTQVTIRDVVLPHALRGRGYLRELVAHLLARPGVQAVQLEAVINQRLAESVARDPQWVLQGRSGWKPGAPVDAYSPSFAVFRSPAPAIAEQ